MRDPQYERTGPYPRDTDYSCVCVGGGGVSRGVPPTKILNFDMSNVAFWQYWSGEYRTNRTGGYGLEGCVLSHLKPAELYILSCGKDVF